MIILTNEGDLELDNYLVVNRTSDGRLARERNQMSNARRHASRVACVDGETVDVYFAQSSAQDVDLLGLRPAGDLGRWHRADKCKCPVLSTETAAEWNADCPRRGERNRWAVLYRAVNRHGAGLPRRGDPRRDF
jgi:hypothetical protein